MADISYNLSTGDEVTADIMAEIKSAVNSKADKASPTFTGTPAAPTATPGTNTTQIATTAFVQAAVEGVEAGATEWGAITGDIADQTDLSTAINSAVSTAVNALTTGAPAALDTLNEIAAAINDDASYASTITSALALKAPLASPTFTGTVAGITKAMVGLGNVANVDQTNAANLSSGTIPAGRIAGTATDGFVAKLVSGVPTWQAESGGGGGVTGTGTTGTLAAWASSSSIGNAPITYSGNNISVTGGVTAGTYLKPSGGTHSAGAGNIIYETVNGFGITVQGKAAPGGYSHIALTSDDGSGKMYVMDNRVVFPATYSTNVHVGSDAGTTIPSAILAVNATSGGFAPPRMTATQASAITSPADGIMLYTTDTNGTFTSIGFWGRENGAWVKL